MGVEPPAQQSSSGDSDSNSDSDSDNSDSCSQSSSTSECSAREQGRGAGMRAAKPRAAQQRFSVTSSESGLRLKIAAIPRTRASAVPTAAARKGPASSSDGSCSECRSDREGGPRKASKGPKLTATVYRKGSSDSEGGPPDKPRGRPRSKTGTRVGAGVGSDSSSRQSGSSRSCSSDSESESDSSAALAASCSLQVINEEDLAAILPEHQPCAGFPGFPEQTPAPSETSAPSVPSDVIIPDSAEPAQIAQPPPAEPVEPEGSGSEMELPPQLVDAAILRAAADSSGSETERADLPDAARYASSLLQQFEVQTQLLSHARPHAPPPEPPPPAAPPPCPVSESSPADGKRKRGRPRKVKDEPSGVDEPSAVCDESEPDGPPADFRRGDDPPNVSPDSGILSSRNSPAPSPPREPRTRGKPPRKGGGRPRAGSERSPPGRPPARLEKKLDMATLDRMLYATDRVLYPARRRAGRPAQSESGIRRGPGRPPKLPIPQTADSADSEDEPTPATGAAAVLAGVYAKRRDLRRLAAPTKGVRGPDAWRDDRRDRDDPDDREDDPLDPCWREIDLNPKYRDILSGYRSDHEIKSRKSCSRLIESGYKSDYGFKSGYRTDHCSKSGYKSDHKSGYKSDKSGYKSDHSVRNMRRKMRKLKKSRSVRDRSYYKNQKHFASDREILLLANKTFGLLSLGRGGSDSESEGRSQASYLPSKFTRDGGALASKITFGVPARLASATTLDPFAPAPVFGGPALRLAPALKYPFSAPFSTGASVFDHKFGCPPISRPRGEPFRLSAVRAPEATTNNNSVKQSCRNSSPKVRKVPKVLDICTAVTRPAVEKEKSPLLAANLFRQPQSSYVPGKALSRNIFLNLKKPPKKSSSQWKKRKSPLVIVPIKVGLPKSSANGRLSRMSSKSSTESKHHRHKLKKIKRQRSRSVSRTREANSRTSAAPLDHKFTLEMENLIDNFMKSCHTTPKMISQQSLKISSDKIGSENASKNTKRASKKRKGSENLEVSTPTSKRRHKKQPQESQSKGGKDPGAEHKLPLKKRHYHINSSTGNSLSLSLVSSDKTESAEEADAFLCTESNCLGDLSSKVASKGNSACKKDPISAKAMESESIKICAAGPLVLDVQESVTGFPVSRISPSLVGTDDELDIEKPIGEHSELSKKIYEASEKLKAVNRMVHDLEKSLPKTKDSEVIIKDDSIKSTHSKFDTKNATNGSPIVAGTVSTVKPASAVKPAPIVTPKKRHRLEADRLAYSSLDLVVQSLSKKLFEDNALQSDKHEANTLTTVESLDVERKREDSEGHRTSSLRIAGKNAPPVIQKSEIITRKKNRLEGLTSNLVSKIVPSSATKVLDTLMGNNLRKSIESRILERSKCGDPASPPGDTTARATVIKSPVSKLKLPAEAKKLPKGTDILIEETISVNVDKPTGIFEPSLDIELHIPKSSITLSHMNLHSPLRSSKFSAKNGDGKLCGKITKVHLEGENQIPVSVVSDVTNKIRKNESIAAVISDKILESGHNLRHSKRNYAGEADSPAAHTTAVHVNDKKKKKIPCNILKESKFKLHPKSILTKLQMEKRVDIVKEAHTKPESETENVVVKNLENLPSKQLSDSSIPLKKRAKRRKTINRTGFPSIKKKKKKLSVPVVVVNEIRNETNPVILEVEKDGGKVSSAFERVPKVGEATNSFLERTTRKKQGELKVLINKDDCPKQGRVSVIALERLQAKNVSDNNNVPCKNQTPTSQEPKGSKGHSIVSANAVIPDAAVSDAVVLDSVAKWEILSETDSLPPLSSGSIGNDPEDSIPLSLLNLKAERPNSRLELKGDRIKRKLRDISPCDSLENVSLSKRLLEERNLKIKSSNTVKDGDSKRTAQNDKNSNLREANIPNSISRKSKNKRPGRKSEKLSSTSSRRITKSPNAENGEIIKGSSAPSTEHGRKSRNSNAVKRLREVTPSSRDSSLETVKAIKKSPKSRDASVETLKRSQDSCLENDPLPLQEKEIDFEKSIDVLSKSIISKKRMASSRDDSPASSVERGYRSERDRPCGKRNPRTRKKYLVAGLFSDYYKDNDPKSIDHKSKSTYNSLDYPLGLLAPPPYCERWVRQRRLHFTLPYDIWWQHQYNQPVPSWNYRKIRTNVYYDIKPTPDGCESQACNCRPSTECQDDCINRMVYAECSPQLCPCKELCKNQRIQRHEWAPGLDKFMTENKGWGVRTEAAITNGTFILEYVGEVVSDKEFKERMASRYVKDTHHYCLHLDGGLVIDGHRMGGEGRFVNHSCQPNCEMQKWSVNGLFRMALFALRDIRAGEELTYDYNFSLFNPAEGQPCRCDSDDCRGVIGGKSQRVPKPAKPAVPGPVAPNRVGRPRKAAKPCASAGDALEREAQGGRGGRLWAEPLPRVLSSRERGLVREGRCFLPRNLHRARRARERLLAQPGPPIGAGAFLTRLHALRAPRSMRTRRLALAEDDPHLSKHARLANVFRELYNAVVNARDEKNERLCSPLLRKKGPRTTESPDLAAIESNIESGVYTSPAQLDAHFTALLAEAGGRSGPGGAALQLRKVYNNAKLDFAEQLTNILGPDECLPHGFLQKGKQEEVILCVCGLHSEEGLMVQCGEGEGGCGVWQHARCMAVADLREPHLCHRCLPRPVELEIPLDDCTEDGHRFYLSLLRGELQVRQGDTVYVLRDIPVDPPRPDQGPKRRKIKDAKQEGVRKHTYKTIGAIGVSELDIFRVERLWRDSVTGQRYVYGHHYLRPHETYHEPTRKFFPNEVMRVPLYEAVPIELVMSQCWVMDLNTYCKGRPLAAQEEHVYICELRVDKCARLFTKIARPKYPVCTKSYAFEMFPQRLKITRTYAPHEVSPSLLKKSSRKDSAGSGPRSGAASRGAVSRGAASRSSGNPRTSTLAQLKPSSAALHTRAARRSRLNAILLKLLASMPTKQPLDMSYLLDGRRQRKKMISS